MKPTRREAILAFLQHLSHTSIQYAVASPTSLANAQSKVVIYFVTRPQLETEHPRGYAHRQGCPGDFVSLSFGDDGDSSRLRSSAATVVTAPAALKAPDFRPQLTETPSLMKTRKLISFPTCPHSLLHSSCYGYRWCSRVASCSVPTCEDLEHPCIPGT
jgi:hypothetical protein